METTKEETRSTRKTFQGLVVSDKMNKTRVVSVERLVKHNKYEKILKRTSKFYAHDESNEAKTGDIVEIMSIRPLSKLKRWRVTRIVTKAQA